MNVFPTLNTRNACPTPTADKLRVAYLWYRYRSAPGYMAPASNALHNARTGSAHVGQFAPVAHGAYNPATSDGYRWVESADDAGLRFVGFADELCRSIDHKGWFTDEFQDGTLRGVVYQLPARKGRALYVGGYADAWNKGAALLDFSRVEYGEIGGAEWADDGDAQKEAARIGDGMAETAAEDEREYQQAWQAGNEYADLGEEARSLRQRAREVIQQGRGLELPSAVCKALRDSLRRELDRIEFIRERRHELRTDYDNNWQRDAFNDGAGL